MIIKPCPFCGNMPKIETVMSDPIPLLPAHITMVRFRVDIHCSPCYLYKGIERDTIIDVPVYTWIVDKKIRRKAKKLYVEGMIDEIWNRRAEWQGTT